MKILLASASPADVRWAADHGLADGVVTTPAALAAERGGDAAAQRELLGEIARALPAPVHASVASVDPADMYRDGRELARIADNVVVQVPLVDEAVGVLRRLSAEGVRVSATLVFSAAQALLAAKAGAAFISPFVGRLDDYGADGTDLIQEIRVVYDNYDFDTETLAASIRNPGHLRASAIAGADCATIPPAVFKALIKHPLTEKGLQQFTDDWAKTGQSIL